MNPSKYNSKLDPNYLSTQQARDAAKKADAENARAIVAGQRRVTQTMGNIHEATLADRKALDAKAGALGSATRAVNAQSEKRVTVATTEGEDALLARPKGAKVDDKTAPAAVKLNASDTTGNNEMLSEGGNIQAGDGKHRIREPSALTGGLSPLPATHAISADSEMGPAPKGPVH